MAARVLTFSTAAVAAEPMPQEFNTATRLAKKFQALERAQPEMAKAIERCVDVGLAMPRAAS